MSFFEERMITRTGNSTEICSHTIATLCICLFLIHTSELLYLRLITKQSCFLQFYSKYLPFYRDFNKQDSSLPRTESAQVPR